MAAGRCILGFFAAAGVVISEAKGTATVTPIQKVLSMLEDMLAKGKTERDAEATRFSSFSTWCSDQKRIKSKEIAGANAEMEQLQATIDKNEADIRKRTERIDELEADVARWTKDKASTADVRKKEAIDFKATVLDYSESIDAIAGAISLLKKQAYNRPQAAVEQALLQVRDKNLVPPSAKFALTAFLQHQEPDEMLFRKAPEAYGYQFQSGGVVDMLEKLADKFDTERRELQKEEMSAQHAFEVIRQQLTDNVENAEHEISKKTELRSEAQEAKAEAEGDLAQTTKDRDEDQKYADDAAALCEQKSRDFESRQKLRGEEIVALAKAIEIISSKSVAGAGEKNLPTLLQKPRSQVALVSLRQANQSPFQERAAAFLASRAQDSGSRLLSEAARRMTDGPFDKVKKMIKDLIVRLMEEANAETEHKGWCDSELVANKLTREARTDDVNSLTAGIEGLTADILQLTQDLAELSEGIKELDAAMATQTSDRASNKAANQQTIAEAKEAQSAVEEAIAVLKEYYAKSAQATAFVQQTPLDDAPETFAKPYQGMLVEGGNVVEFLEVILSDFARLESETDAAEAADQQVFEEFMFESRKDKAVKETEVSHKSNTKTDKESSLHKMQAELKDTQGQLDKAIAYYDKLTPTCVSSGITYEERVQQRKEEIRSLQEALQILAGQDLPTLA
eukprot:TRINITY_DN95_c0_g1_i1.p1 TRINITY_DN95_c0_g1~~TRINITY_DN95_c0_g1_i1.p1  ORF type:complete len:708 (+),score=189.60 TRINITY_DN95_c0_g1_i1:80-2125(+)